MTGLLIKFVIATVAVFTALGIVCAVTISLRRKVQADPYLNPFGDMPRVPDRSPRQTLSVRSAMNRTDAGSGRESVTSTAAARSLLRGGL